MVLLIGCIKEEAMDVSCMHITSTLKKVKDTAVGDIV